MFLQGCNHGLGLLAAARPHNWRDGNAKTLSGAAFSAGKRLGNTSNAAGQQLKCGPEHEQREQCRGNQTKAAP